MWNLIIMFAVATLSGLLFEKAKMPLGLMVGAMIGVAALNICTGCARYSPALKLLMQILIGTCIGCKIGKEQLHTLRRVVLPTVVVCLSTTAFTIIFGFLVYKATSFDLPTALFSIAPGGAADMAIISSEYGANETSVSIINTFRIIFIVSVFLPISLAVLNKKPGEQEAAHEKEPVPIPHSKQRYCNIFVLFVIATIGGLFFDLCLHISAGGILGSMLFSAIYCCLTNVVVMPKHLVYAKQIIQGGYSGSLITASILSSASELILPLIIEVIFIVTYTLCTGWAIWKLCHRRMKFSLIVPTPGGIGEIAAVSDALGEDTPSIVVVQTVRLFYVLSILPLVLRMVL